MKVSELEGKKLDYWVARAIGYEHHGAVGVHVENDSGVPWCRSDQNDWWKSPTGAWVCGPCNGFPENYSTDWAHGGPLIEQFMISIHWYGPCVPRSWGARTANVGRTEIVHAEGSTALIAAMRALVIAKFGEDVPEEKA